MLRHKGKSRTFSHNLRLAAILSFIAGLVNISGVLSIKTLTTNITGHFAFFAEELINNRYASAFAFLLFILSFFLGAFVSNLLVEIISRARPQFSHSIPMVIEICIISAVGFYGSRMSVQLSACGLLFAMGLQNSLVTHISSATVRTTHLTGLFTDLGIELSQLFFYRDKADLTRLNKSILLRLMIILFFFLGCVSGGFLYRVFGLKTLFIASGCLVLALLFDTIRYRYYFIKRKLLLRSQAT